MLTILCKECTRSKRLNLPLRGLCWRLLTRWRSNSLKAINTEHTFSEALALSQPGVRSLASTKQSQCLRSPGPEPLWNIAESMQNPKQVKVIIPGSRQPQTFNHLHEIKPLPSGLVYKGWWAWIINSERKDTASCS